MPKKRRKIDDASIASLKTHVEYIREAIDRLDSQLTERIKWGQENMDRMSKNFKAMDARIQTLEDRKDFTEKEWNKKMAKWGVAIGVISIAVGVIIALFL